jgi:membrane-associated phospholipid phosphatase
MHAFLLHCDQALFCAINSHHAGLWDAFFWTFSYLGNGWVITPILLIVAILKVPRKIFWPFFAFAAGGMILCGVINSQIKNLVHRDRPTCYFASHNVNCTDARNGTYQVHVVGTQLSYGSFPSGHTNTAFSAATLLALMFGGWYWLCFIPAIIVGYSRIYMGVHFPLDVVAGAMIGMAIIGLTFIVYTKISRRSNKGYE